MKFKSSTNNPIYVASLSGHCASVGTEWRELPVSLHKEALAAGCVTDNMDQATLSEITGFNTPQEAFGDVVASEIKRMMANPMEGDFTAEDLPNLKRLSSNLGRSVSREEMMQAVNAMR